MAALPPFGSLYAHGFARVAAAVPHARPAEPDFNAERVLALARRASDVGAPLRAEHGLFNCAVVIHRGRVLGVVPKSYLPEYREYYEKRQFRAARDLVANEIELLGERVPCGHGMLFACRDLPGLVVHVEVCEDLWVPIPPSTYAALAGATGLANLSASNITIGKADYRKLLCRSHSGRMLAGYVFTAAGAGES